MKFFRLIPRIDIKDADCIKSICFEGVKPVGKPKDLAMKYFKQGADEIIYMDMVASLYRREFNFEQLKNVSKDIFIPFTVGGGIRSLADIKKALRCGADKVAINTYAVTHPELINKAVAAFGSQCIVISVEAKKIFQDRWEVYTDMGRQKTGIDVIDWIQRMQNAGAGEILISSVDNDGLMSGYELDLVKTVSAIVTVPLIVHGGAGKPEHMLKAIECGADAVSAASVYHYGLWNIGQAKNYLENTGTSTR